MQLKKPNKLRQALAAATYTLLGTSAQDGAAEDNDHKWEFDSAILYYSETDRVSAVEPVISARREIGDNQFLSARLVVDVLTGASASGATATNRDQTFTRPSGNGTYTIKAGETPLDDTFLDTRIALSGNWEKPLTQTIRSNLGIAVSTEYDYLSIGANSMFSVDLNKRNMTLQAGLSFAADTIDPEGGVPIPFARMGPQGPNQPRETDSESRTTIDFLLGVTQVLGRNTLAQINYSFSNSTGYHTDPFKFLSVVDANTGVTLEELEGGIVFENRPDDRQKHGIYTSIKHHFSRDIADASYRFFIDDWGITSHTIDLHYRWNFRPQQYLQPHFRFYQQSEADFYRHSLVDGKDNDPFPEHATADYRLGEFTATTVGLKYGYKFKNSSEFSMRGEYYLQTGDSNPDDAIGDQRNQDLYPDVDAIIVQLNYSFRW